MATLYIDNKPYEVTPGKNLLEACLSLGIDLPYFCWHPALGSVGACRQCAIKVYKDENDKKGRLIMSCMEPVTDRQRISVTDPEATEFREQVIGWLMTNHPHDCAICDEGGSCHLQDMTVMTGHAYRKFRYKKRTYRNQYLGPFINHEMNRCIQCYRCVRFYKDYAGGRDLDAFASKNHVYFGRHEEGVLENEFSGNLSEVCPTGVFTDKTLKQHYTRKWDLTMAPSVCQHCSLGCNIIAGERYGTLRLINNRYHGEVNGYFICDRGRFGYEFVNVPDRIRKPIRQNQPVGRAEILPELTSLIRKGNIIGIGSPRASLEANYMLRKLVGEEKFYAGVSHTDHALASLTLKLLSEGPVRTPSMKEVEKADAVLILGEDLTNTAPMMALAVRQSVRQQPLKQMPGVNIPLWHDAAVRELVQDSKGPLFIASVINTKLDDVATQTYYAAPDNIARLGFAIAHLLDPASPAVELSAEQHALAETIARTLKEADRPVIISGTSCGSEAILHAAARVTGALHQHNTATGLVLTLPECNSMGLAMLGGNQLQDAFDHVSSEKADAVIILENDLYRHAPSSHVDQFLQNCKRVIVLDHTTHNTARQADIILPAATFAEANGTLVSSEGRAQRFYKVYEPAGEIEENWRWLLQMLSLRESTSENSLHHFEDITRALAGEIPILKDIEQAIEGATHSVNGQKIPREPHRFSGRTAMNAHKNVSEPKPPEDPDSPMSYTMEGYKGLQPSSVIPFFWSPGWNSVQSVNKYQEEVGASLRGGDPGIRLIHPRNEKASYSYPVPGTFIARDGHLLLVPLHHIFGSEELSAKGPAVAERVPDPYVTLNEEDAASLNLKQGDTLSFDIDGQAYALPAMLSTTLPKGVAGLPQGLPGLSYATLPAWGILKKQKQPYG